MKKKALIIISIIVVAFIIILLPKNNSNIEKTTAETNLTKPTPEATPSPTSIPDLTPTPKTETGVTEFNAKQGIIEGYEVNIDNESETTAEEENTEDSSVNSTHTDVVLGDDEYKGDEEETTEEDIDTGLTQEDEDEIRDMMKEILKEQYPELLTEGSTGNTGGAQQGNYESVGTPSTGQFTNPNYTVGESGGEGLSEGGTIY